MNAVIKYQSTALDAQGPTGLQPSIDISMPDDMRWRKRDAINANRFSEYQSTKSANTVDSQRYDLNAFAGHIISELANEGISIGMDAKALGYELHSNPGQWQDINLEYVEGFKRLMIESGVGVQTINRRLSTIRQYAKLAYTAQQLHPLVYLPISELGNYSGKDAANIDRNRNPTKSPKSVNEVTPEQLEAIVDNIDGNEVNVLRDRAIIYLLSEHGLRVSELVLLSAKSVNMNNRLLTFHRPKQSGTKRDTGRHKLTDSTYAALRAWFDYYKGPKENSEDCLFPAIGRWVTGETDTALNFSNPLKRRAIQKLIQDVGQVELPNLSPHDLRHYAATQMAASGYGITELTEWFGWAKADTALEYINSTKMLARDKG